MFGIGNWELGTTCVAFGPTKKTGDTNWKMVGAVCCVGHTCNNKQKTRRTKEEEEKRDHQNDWLDWTEVDSPPGISDTQKNIV